MKKFFCEKCNTFFDSTGEKIEYFSVTYGPCFKYMANCPDCNTACNEYRSHTKKQSSSEFTGCNSKSGRCSCCG